MADSLTNRQLTAITHLLTSSNVEEARRKSRLSKGTLYTWLKDDAFKTEIKRQRNEITKEASFRLRAAMTKAVDVLIGLIDTSKPDLKRLVCKDIIENALKSVELEDLEARLEKVERIQAGK